MTRPSFRHGRVAVLLATYNGADHLDAQVETLARQTVERVDVWASDDGSADGTQEKLARWAARWSKGEFHVLAGPQRGFAANFASLVAHPRIAADHFAFCDQDDLWDSDKLERALAWLETSDQPRVHAGRTRLISSDGEPLGLSPLFTRPPDFRNAIVQSIAGGNTMVLNRAARDLVAETVQRVEFVSHDWWTYMVVTGGGGTMRYDPHPSISYRQHGANAIGANTGWTARRKRLQGMLEGRFRRWNHVNIAALRASDSLLTRDAKETLDRFERIRNKPGPVAPYHLAQAGIYRQTPLGQAGLYLACALGRI